MPTFVFRAKDPTGKEVRGELSAANVQEVQVKLRAQQLIPIGIVLKNTGKGSPGASLTVNSKDLQVFTRQFSVLISAGVPVMQSIEALHRGTSSASLKTALVGIASDVGKGQKLADAAAKYPRIFDRLFVNLLRVGEEAGVLDTVLDRLAIYIEKSVALKGKVTKAMWYPAVIIVVSMAVLSGILIFVIPNFVKMFKDSGRELPELTQIIIKLSEVFVDRWYVIFGGMALAFYGIKIYWETDEGRQNIDKLLIQTPVFGPLIQKSAIARFSRTLSTLLASGVGIIEALEIGAKVSNNYVLETSIMRAREAISKGKSISAPLGQEKYIPNMVVTMISIGEQTGALDTMLGKIADFYDDEVDNAVGAMTTIIEPALMVVLGGIIAVIVIAMYLPIFNLAGG